MVRILLVDDDIAEISAVKRVLLRAGHQAVLATNASDALAAIAQEMPRLALVSATCENGRGLLLAQKLVAEERTAGLPLILLGEAADAPLRVTQLPRPIDPAQLAQELASALSAPPAEPPPPRNGRAPAAPQDGASRSPALRPDGLMADADRRAAADALRSRAAELRRVVEVARLAQAGESDDERRDPFADLGPVAPPAAAPPPADEEASGGALRARRALRGAEGERRQAEEGARRRAAIEQELSRLSDDLSGRDLAPEELEAARAAEQEALRRAEEEAAQAEEEARQRAEAEAAARAAEETRRAEAEARRNAEEARRRAEAEKARARAEEEARRRAEAEAAARAAEEARRRAEAEARRNAEDARRRTEAEKARARAEEEARRRAEAARGAEEARRRAEAEAARRSQDLTARAAEETARRELAARAAARAAQEERRRSPDAERSGEASHLEPPPPPRPAAAAVADAQEEEAGPEARPELEPPPPELAAGTLAEAPMPRLLALAARARLSGRLDFGGDAPRSLYFEDGRVVGATSGAPHERVEEVALRIGLVTREQHRQAMAAASGLPTRRAALLLLDRGWLKPSELTPLVRRRTEEVVFALFAEAAAPFRHAAARVPADERIALERSALALAVEGVRRKWLAQRLDPVLGGAGTLLAPAPHAPSAADLGLTAAEQRLLELADGLRSLDEILAGSPLEVLAARQCLAALVMTGALLVRFHAGADAAAEEPSIDLARVREKLDQVRRADYFAILGLPRSCTPYEIREAADRLIAEFDAGRFAGLAEPGLPAKLSEIRRVVAEAREILGDDELRAGYLAALGENAA